MRACVFRRYRGWTTTPSFIGVRTGSRGRHWLRLCFMHGSEKGSLHSRYWSSEANSKGEKRREPHPRDQHPLHGSLLHLPAQETLEERGSHLTSEVLYPAICCHGVADQAGLTQCRRLKVSQHFTGPGKLSMRSRV